MHITLKEVYEEIAAALKQACIETAELDARFIIEERSSFEMSDIIVNPDQKLDDNCYIQIKQDLNERLTGKPLSRIFGYKDFWGRSFKISENTLDPRPDTERLVDIALERYSKRTSPFEILDLGTGSGCILITLLCEMIHANGCGIDLSKPALKIAKNNAKALNVHDRTVFLQGSWFESVQRKFDLIVSNPPYISNQVIPTLAPEVKNHDPILALDGGDNGLDAYKIIFPQLKNYLKNDGIALFEIGYDQQKEVMRLAEDSTFALRRVHLDHSGNPRVVEISSGDK